MAADASYPSTGTFSTNQFNRTPIFFLNFPLNTIQGPSYCKAEFYAHGLTGIYIVGGGGGISFACGSSRSMSFKLFLLTVVLSVSPVPLLAFLGVIQLESLLHS